MRTCLLATTFGDTKMKVTKKMIQAMYPSHTVTQYGAKQLFLAQFGSEFIILSYRTEIGRVICGRLVLDDVYYSQTTACHKNFLRRLYS